MAHTAQLAFVSILVNSFPTHFSNSNVLEIGSLDINGSVRSLFHNCNYTGLDVAAGRGVDVICQGQQYNAPDGSFDVVISCEAMEHNPHWVGTFQNMIRLCRPGGLVIMTCATVGRPEHGTTRKEPKSSPLTVALKWNYYKNLKARDFRQVVSLEESFVWSHFWTRFQSYDLLFAGVRGPFAVEAELRQGISCAQSEVDAWIGAEQRFRALRYRHYISDYLGDSWFDCMRWAGARVRRLSSLLDRLHEPG